MSATSIEWCEYTFNPWEGCAKVSPGCANCYAETRNDRFHGGKHWGPNAPRLMRSEAYWRQPLKWAREARRMTSTHKPRVFAASLADVCEDRADLVEPRDRLVLTIRETVDALDWLLVTKRPQNFGHLFPRDVLRRCWLLTSVENQETADVRLAHLQQTPAAVRGISLEPMLGPVDLTKVALGTSPHNALTGEHLHESAHSRDWNPLDWVILGSESGPGARPMQTAWAESVRDQCRAAGVAFFTKQIANAADRKGGDPAHWPPGDWPREWPEVTT